MLTSHIYTCIKRGGQTHNLQSWIETQPLSHQLASQKQTVWHIMYKIFMKRLTFSHSASSSVNDSSSDWYSSTRIWGGANAGENILWPPLFSSYFWFIPVIAGFYKLLLVSTCYCWFLLIFFWFLLYISCNYQCFWYLPVISSF